MDDEIVTYDLEVYEKIRNHVNAFLEEQPEKKDHEAIKVLDVAP